MVAVEWRLVFLVVPHRGILVAVVVCHRVGRGRISDSTAHGWSQQFTTNGVREEVVLWRDTGQLNKRDICVGVYSYFKSHIDG